MQVNPLSAEVVTSKVLEGISFCNVTGIRVAVVFDVVFSGDDVGLRLASPDVPPNPDDDDVLPFDDPTIIDHWHQIVQRIRELAERQAARPQAWGSALNSMGLE